MSGRIGGACPVICWEMTRYLHCGNGVTGVLFAGTESQPNTISAGAKGVLKTYPVHGMCGQLCACGLALSLGHHLHLRSACAFVSGLTPQDPLP